jgi:hypothetical protein
LNGSTTSGCSDTSSTHGVRSDTLEPGFVSFVLLDTNGGVR